MERVFLFFLLRERHVTCTKRTKSALVSGLWLSFSFLFFRTKSARAGSPLGNKRGRVVVLCILCITCIT